MALADNPAYNKGRFYYDLGDMRIEMSPVGYSHGQDNGVVYYILLLYATIENIRIKGVVNTSLRRNGIGEVQPESAFYIGDRVISFYPIAVTRSQAEPWERGVRLQEPSNVIASAAWQPSCAGYSAC